MEMTHSQAVERLREWKTITAERDQRVWDAHQSHVSKADIARETGLSWQTVDRIVREMAIRASEEVRELFAKRMEDQRGSSEEGQR